MEEILSSIKRIIAEEGEAPARGRRPGRPAAPSPAALAAAVDEVLELSDPMPATPAAAELSRRAQMQVPVAEKPQSAVFPPAAEPEDEPVAPPRVAAEPVPTAPDPQPEPIASPQTVDASRGALESLARLMVKPEPGSDGTLEGLVRDMLRPMLRDWLDANLPRIVEAAVAREVARIARDRG